MQFYTDFSSDIRLEIRRQLDAASASMLAETCKWEYAANYGRGHGGSSDRRHDASTVTVAAVQHGHVQIVGELMNRLGTALVSTRMLIVAVQARQVAVVKQLCSIVERKSIQVCKELPLHASRQGNYELLVYLVEEVGINVFPELLRPAVAFSSSGHVAVFKYCLDRVENLGLIHPDMICAWSGSREMLDYFFAKFPVYSSRKTVRVRLTAAAVRGGHVELFKYLVDEMKFPYDNRSYEGAYESNTVDALREYWSRIQATLTPYCFRAAASKGHMELLMRLMQEWGGNPSTLDVMYAGCEHEEVVLYFIEQGCPPSKADLNNALQRGWLSVTQLLRQHGVGYSKSALYLAIQGNNLDCVRFVLDDGCHVRSNIMLFAASAGNISIMKMLHEHPRVPHYAPAPCVCASQGHLDALRFLETVGYKLDEDALAEAASGGQLTMLKFLVEQRGIKITCESIAGAAASNSVQCWKYLLSHSCSIDKVELLNYLDVRGVAEDDLNSDLRALIDAFCCSGPVIETEPDHECAQFH